MLASHLPLPPTFPLPPSLPLPSHPLCIPLLIVDTGKVSVYDGMIGAKTERSEISSHSPVENPRFFQHVAKVDVGIQKGRIQLYGLRGGKGGS